MTKEEIRRYLEFYQDLGVKTVFVRAADQPVVVETAELAVEPEPRRESEPAPVKLPALEPAGDSLLKILEDIGASRVEPSEDLESYPAIFFEDPAGTKLELAARMLPRAE